MRARLRGSILALALSGCIGSSFGIEIVEPPPPPPEPPVPDRFVGDTAPELVSSELPGFKKAPSLDPSVYFLEKERHWYRFALNRWYLGFTWDGNWFPVEADEVPAALRALTPSIREVSAQEAGKKEKTREEKLRELDERLRELETKP